MNPETWVKAELDALREAGLNRSLRAIECVGGKFISDKRGVLNLAGNDYLDLANNRQVIAAAARLLKKAGCGARASRLITGTYPWHIELERRLAAFKGYPAALVFGSGFLANIGIVSAVAGRDDTIYLDRLAHASLIDAAILSRATIRRFRHNDTAHLAHLLRNDRSSGGKKLIATESVFSMDGDLAFLPDLARVAREHQAMLLVDEAHATGVFGPGGRGLVNAHGLETDVNLAMGTLSKAFGGYGGFVACSERMRDFLINRARSFIYTTALPPAVVGAALGALEWVEDHPDAGRILLERAATLRRRLRAAGLDTGASASQIIPIIIGDNRRIQAIAARLRAAGIIVAAIRPPTVPEGTARLRFSVSLAHTDGELARAAETIIRTVRSVK